MHRLPAGLLRLSPELHGRAWWWLAEGRLAMGDWGPNGQLIETRVVHAGHWFDVASAWSGPGWIEEAVCCAPWSCGPCRSTRWPSPAAATRY